MSFAHPQDLIQNVETRGLLSTVSTLAEDPGWGYRDFAVSFQKALEEHGVEENADFRFKRMSPDVLAWLPQHLKSGYTVSKVRPCEPFAQDLLWHLLALWAEAKNYNISDCLKVMHACRQAIDPSVKVVALHHFRTECGSRHVVFGSTFAHEKTPEKPGVKAISHRKALVTPVLEASKDLDRTARELWRECKTLASEAGEHAKKELLGKIQISTGTGKEEEEKEKEKRFHETYPHFRTATKSNPFGQCAETAGLALFLATSLVIDQVVACVVGQDGKLIPPCFADFGRYHFLTQYKDMKITLCYETKGDVRMASQLQEEILSHFKDKDWSREKLPTFRLGSEVEN